MARVITCHPARSFVCVSCCSPLSVERDEVGALSLPPVLRCAACCMAIADAMHGPASTRAQTVRQWAEG